LTSGHPQRPSPNCCTSNVNSPCRLRGHDDCGCVDCIAIDRYV
jgi:hypothetical protein